MEEIIPDPIIFEWDKGNLDKNLKKHGINNEEAEQVFLNEPKLVSEDLVHTTKLEKRYQCLGQTDTNKWLFISFTIKKVKIRIISTRLQSRKERRIYEKELKTNTKF